MRLLLLEKNYIIIFCLNFFMSKMRNVVILRLIFTQWQIKPGHGSTEFTDRCAIELQKHRIVWVEGTFKGQLFQPP